MIVIRKWVKNSQITNNATEVLDIWDSGTHRYERWPDGTEVYWKVIAKALTETGFEEHLEKMPHWETPAKVVIQEKIPLVKVSETQYQFGQWSVTQDQAQAQKKAQAQQMAQAQQKPRKGYMRTSEQGQMRHDNRQQVNRRHEYSQTKVQQRIQPRPQAQQGQQALLR